VENGEREKQLLGLKLQCLSLGNSTFAPAQVADGVFEVGAIDQGTDVEVVAVIAHAVEGLVEGGEPLLAIQN
jgi:hypothetical protein